MTMRWTKEQTEVIDDRGNNLLVSAAAGSGKTAVLIERIKKLVIEDQIDIDRLLVVTFTNAASREIRERILETLTEVLKESKENSEFIKKQINMINKASISTLHSFCMEMLRKYFYIIDLDPNFRIANGTEKEIIIQETLEEILEENYNRISKMEDSDRKRENIDMLEYFTSDRDDRDLEKFILRLYYFIQSQPNPYTWLKEMTDMYNVDRDKLLDSLWLKESLYSIKRDIIDAKEVLEKAIELIESNPDFENYLEAIEDDYRVANELLNNVENRNMNALEEMISNIKLKQLGRVTISKDDIEGLDIRAKIQSYRKLAKEKFEGIRDIFPYDIDNIIKENRETIYPMMKKLNQIVKKFNIRYLKKKKEIGIVDFNDLEHMTLSILKNLEIAEEIREKYELIFIDEYQDTNLVQETIIESISRKNNRFLVGDVKQSIYRFRLADPTIFLEKYRRYKKSEDGKRIDLARNFRSRREITNGINELFKEIMTEDLGELDYGENEYLVNGAEYEDIENNKIELNIIDKSVTNKKVREDENLLDLGNQELEARFITKRIKELIGTKTYNVKLGKYEKIEYKDIVILLRTMKNWGEVYEEILNEKNIPIYLDNASGYFESIEIKVFLNLLKIVDNTHQDIPLLSVMRSSIGSFKLEELVEIRAMKKDGTYYDAVIEYMNVFNDTDDELWHKLNSFILKLNNWKRESKYYKLDEFIWKLLDESKYYSFVGGMVGGKQRQSNLRMLLDRANEFEKTSINGLFNFILFFDKLRDIDADMGVAKTIGEKDNVVRIISIHKSKGLEFPVVICGGLGKEFNMMDSREKLSLHKELGIGFRYIDLEQRVYKKTISEKIILRKIKQETLSEEMRILYVAMTRAKDKLILYGVEDSVEKIFEERHISKAKSFLDWIKIGIIDANNIREDDFKDDIKVIDDWEIILKRDLDDSIEVRVMEEKDKLEDIVKDVGNTDTVYLDKILKWNYRYSEDTITPSKVSVTYLQREGKDGDMGIVLPELIEYPKFMDRKEKGTAAEIGSLNHRILELIDFNTTWDGEKFKKYLLRLNETDIIETSELETLDFKDILNFLGSELYNRIRNSKKVKKEQSFVYAKEKLSGGVMYIQGIIDCYFEENGEIVIVDYKSDDIKNISELNRRYAKQLELYKDAVTDITGKNVKETYLYSLKLNDFYKKSY